MNIARQRLVNQRLIDRPFTTAADVVRWLGAVQSQDFPNAKWALGLRMRAATNEQIDDAFNRGEILRTHALRPTWHFLAADDVRWILKLTAPRVQAANAGIYRRYELDDTAFRAARRIITKILAGKQSLTRGEIAQHLNAKGMNAIGQRATYIVMHAELCGLICSGPIRNKQHTYMLLDERTPPGAALDGDAAIAELARRYYQSHGPATVHDFAWWSGFSVGQARRAVEMVGQELISTAIDGKTYYFRDAVAARVRSPVIHFLPNYDEHVVAYRDHGPSLDPRTPDALAGWGNGLTSHVVSLNGLAVGGWRRTLDKTGVAVRLSLGVRLKPGERAGLARAAARYGAFVGLPVALSS